VVTTTVSMMMGVQGKLEFLNAMVPTIIGRHGYLMVVFDATARDVEQVVRFAEAVLENVQNVQRVQNVVGMGMEMEIGIVVGAGLVAAALVVTGVLSEEAILEKSPGYDEATGSTSNEHKREVHHDQTDFDGPSKQGK
jgi:hypothetical protein